MPTGIIQNGRGDAIVSEGEITIKPEDAHRAMAQLVEQMISLPVDFSDIPLIPENIPAGDMEILNRAVALAVAGKWDMAARTAQETVSDSFEADYLSGKIMLASKLYFEASVFFNLAVTKFSGYGELWFLYGVCLYQMGLYSEAFMSWREALRANANHQDAHILLKLANVMIDKTHLHLNPEAEFALPIVSGRGIDVGCGGAKTHPDAIGVDIIPPGDVGTEASQKGRVSQADILGNGDDLHMFADGELDYVIARHNLEHYVDPVKTLLEWRRVLKPGGVIGLILPDDDEFDTLRADPTHLSVFTKSSFRTLVSLVDGLELAAMGISRHKWSFYAIVEKVAPGGKPKYDYARALNSWLSRQVHHRAKAAKDARVNDVADAAYKKLAELSPETRMEATPGSLWPIGIEGVEIPFSQRGAGLRIAIMGGGTLGKGIRDVIRRSGALAEVVPLAEERIVNWRVEKILREYLADYLLSFTFEPKIATLASDSRTPVIFWLTEPVVDEPKTRMDFDLSYCVIFTTINGEVEKFRRMGAKHVYYSPAFFNEDVFNIGSNSRNEECVIAGPDESSTRYFQLIERLRQRIAAKESSIPEKNAIFALIRKFGMAMESIEANPFGRSSLETLKGSLSNIGVYGLTADEIFYAIAEEVALRRLRTLVETTKSKLVKTTDPQSRSSVFSNAKTVVALTPVSHEESLPQIALEAMASGALALINETSGMKRFFKDGEGLKYYRDFKEAAQLAERYRSNAVERDEIVNAGRPALSRHTLASRWNEIFETTKEVAKEIR
ncbi:MAG: glycosyltransferase [Nitrospinae bacterium]|nr:glycosyltransferase [Nitrospinota bacterium]MBF0634239.1 glycosyltransferase [Nitrospinota bacterium]